ncbi:RidA family protein [Lutispora saccharofermentans]|uniref:Rid family detoxifying hydrolase n=1 Tax=Lutispora saccharofermentans TaxID=3024236 RepID=A0ABT1NK74_9FIRM|nr:Rid family detoxifying hydrolase [Lutispora saccharofermentans]MCQ1530676.1 Rid family detoxifying hydrolase [Lutispora saccharofermentans]
MSIRYIAAESVPSSPLFSQGIIAGQFLFTSGQLGLNRSNDEMENLTFEDEFAQALENIRAILKSEMLDLDNVIKVTIYITDIGQFDSLNDIYLRYFPKHKPARSCIVVNSLAKGARVEIEAVAFSDKM